MSAEQGDLPRYSRSIRKAFAALETASLNIQDPNNISAVERERLDRARTRLEARGIPEDVIEQHTIATAPAISNPDQIPTEPEYGDFRTYDIEGTATWDILLSGKPVIVDFEEVVRKGYTPRSPQLRPLPPLESNK